MTTPANRIVLALREQAPQAWPLWGGAAAAALGVALLLGPAAQWQAEAEAGLARLAAAPGGAHRPASSLPPEAARLPVLPDSARSPERSAQLSQLARRHGLQVLRLREQWDAAGQLQLSLSARGPYTRWRAFTAAALADDPAVVLERLRLQRPDAEAPVLDGETQWTFLHRAAADKPAAPELRR